MHAPIADPSLSGLPAGLVRTLPCVYHVILQKPRYGNHPPLDPSCDRAPVSPFPLAI